MLCSRIETTTKQEFCYMVVSIRGSRLLNHRIIGLKHMPQASYHFPRGFLWGTATAAHQVEGNNTNNQWWKWEAGRSYRREVWSGLRLVGRPLEGRLRPRRGRRTKRASLFGGVEPHPADAGYVGRRRARTLSQHVARIA